MKKVIAIDGPSGAGKSTISKLLAERLGFQFLDTGALYRAAALHLIEKGLDENSSDDVISSVLSKIEITFIDDEVCILDKFSQQNNLLAFTLCRDISQDIRTPKVGHYASVFSARKPVRDFLLNAQRDTALSNDIVAEGRDMTTVVFPDAWKKFYLDASEVERANRRYNQLRAKNMGITWEEALTDIKDRDMRDMSRDIAPLKRAQDASYIDTSDMSPEEVINYILQMI